MDLKRSSTKGQPSENSLFSKFVVVPGLSFQPLFQVLGDQFGPGVQLRRTSYDLTQAAERIRATPYPQAQEAAQNVLQPPSEAEMLELFSKAELR